MFPYGTIFRFYPDAGKNEHYTAIVIYHKGTIKELKSIESDREVIYDSLDDWLYSLPYEDVTVDHLYINLKRYLVTDKICNVPLRNERRTALKWGKYIYNVIHTYAPHLLHQEEVVTAYNELIAYLTNNASLIVMWMPKDALTYIRSILIDDDRFMPVHCTFTINRPENRIIIPTIRDKYVSLFEHIKEDIVPLIQAKDTAYRATYIIPSCKKKIIKLIRQQINAEEKHKKQMEQLPVILDKRITHLKKVYNGRIYIYQYKYNKKLQELQAVLENLDPTLPEKQRDRIQFKQEKRILQHQQSHTKKTAYHEKKHQAYIDRVKRRSHVHQENIENAYIKKMERFADHIAHYTEQIKIYSSA